MNVTQINKKGVVRKRLAPRWVERAAIIALGLQLAFDIAIVTLLVLLRMG